MERQAGYHEMVPGRRVFVFMRRIRSNASTSALEDQTEKIAGNELDGVSVAAKLIAEALRKELTILVYDSGLILEFSGPKAYTILLKHK